ncbi:hypothetical protein MLD38_031758, partial [Melastoma candidum]
TLLSLVYPTMASSRLVIVSCVIFSISLMLADAQPASLVSAGVTSACKTTPDPSFCKSSLPSNGTADVHYYGRYSLKKSLSQAQKFLSLVNRYLSRGSLTPSAIGALRDCQLLASLNLDYLLNSFQALNNNATTLPLQKADDVQTLLSAVLTNQQSCLDGLQSTASAWSVKNGLSQPLANNTKLFTVSLALFTKAWVPYWKLKLPKQLRSIPVSNGRLSLSMSRATQSVLQSASRRKVIEQSTGAGTVQVSDMVVVSQDGSGNFTTITDAVSAAPNNTDGSNGYFLIYVKAGIYQENVSIAKNKKYLMMMGDGINQTIITGNRSVVDGWTTFNSATFDTRKFVHYPTLKPFHCTTTMLKSSLKMMSKPLLLFTVLTSSYYFLGPRSPVHGRKGIHVRNHLQLKANDLCAGTLYNELCVSTLLSFPGLMSKSVPEIISTALNQTTLEVSAASSSCSDIKKRRRGLGQLERQALADCVELFDSTMSELAGAVHDLSVNHPEQYYRDLQTLLSGAMTNQYTCLDGFAFSKEKETIRELFEGKVVNISRHVSNSLAMLRKLPGRPSAEVDEGEAFPGYGKVEGGFPSWISSHDRKLLQAAVSRTPINLTVAKDGTGNFTTVSEAIAAAPKNSATRFVIYVKAGAYFENVEIVRKQTNLMLIGDGIGQTLIKGSRNVVDGYTTFRSATFAVVGNGFIAKGITFENYAGPSKHQAGNEWLNGTGIPYYSGLTG